jgi:hypothetical protein
MLDQDNEGATFGRLEITRRRILFTSGGLNLSTSPVRNSRETRTTGRMANFTFLRGWAKIANFCIGSEGDISLVALCDFPVQLFPKGAGIVGRFERKAPELSLAVS